MKEKIKILISLTISLLVVSNLSPHIFLADTPKINSKFLADLKNYPARLLTLYTQTGRSQGIKEYPPVNLSEIPLKSVSKGVYAGETANLKYIRIVHSEISWQDIELRTKSGKTIKLRYPKDQPPTQEMLNIIKSE